ncbi:hypothetical protein B0H13DRAFT_2552227 [Mycena leptocephala]|nr:hypothetical protein B0H13DRAFT_2552227 [Mycena leptocephala]
MDKNVKRQGTIEARKIIKICNDLCAKYHQDPSLSVARCNGKDDVETAPPTPLARGHHHTVVAQRAPKVRRNTTSKPPPRSRSHPTKPPNSKRHPHPARRHEQERRGAQEGRAGGGAGGGREGGEGSRGRRGDERARRGREGGEGGWLGFIVGAVVLALADEKVKEGGGRQERQVEKERQVERQGEQMGDQTPAQARTPSSAPRPLPAPLALQRARWRDVHRLGGQGRHKRARPLRLARRSGRSTRTRTPPPPASIATERNQWLAQLHCPRRKRSAASAGGKSSGGKAARAGEEMMCLRTRRRGRRGWVGPGAGARGGRAGVRASRWAMQTRDLVYKRKRRRKEVLEDTYGAGEEVKGVEHDKDTGYSRQSANDARCGKGRASSPSLSSALSCFSRTAVAAAEDGLLVFRIERGHALAANTRRRCCGGRTP